MMDERKMSSTLCSFVVSVRESRIDENPYRRPVSSRGMSIVRFTIKLSLR